MMTSTLNNTLSTAAFYALLALTKQTLHGYGVRDQIAADSDSDLVLAMGTVYPLLERLVKERLIERIEIDAESTRMACQYRLTRLGRRRLEGEVRRLERVTMQARYKMTGKVPF